MGTPGELNMLINKFGASWSSQPIYNIYKLNDLQLEYDFPCFLPSQLQVEWAVQGRGRSASPYRWSDLTPSTVARRPCPWPTPWPLPTHPWRRGKVGFRILDLTSALYILLTCIKKYMFVFCDLTDLPFLLQLFSLT